MTLPAACRFPSRRPVIALALLAGGGLLVRPCVAAEPAPAGVISLSASASVEVAKDVLAITLTTARDGADAAVVQTALKQALDAALAEAKKVAKPGAVDVQTGNFSLYPKYNSKGQAGGWQGSAELLVQGQDMPTIAKLTGRITTMTISNVAYSLSREQRARVEGDAAAQAIASFRSRAAEYARQFGYTDYVVREVSVSSNEPGGFEPRGVRATSMAKFSDEALPVEPGKGAVTVTVNGSVQAR